jgi:hypothetical protein
LQISEVAQTFWVLFWNTQYDLYGRNVFFTFMKFPKIPAGTDLYNRLPGEIVISGKGGDMSL